MTLAHRRATHARHYCQAPQQTDADGSRHWITRAANFVAVVTEAAKGAVLARTAQPDEYMAFLRRLSRDALIDGIPYRQYWGEVLTSGVERKQPPAPRYRVLRPEDEAEVERLYQRLKTVGNLDQKNSTDEK